MTSSSDQYSSLPISSTVELELENPDGAGDNIEVDVVSIVIEKDSSAMNQGVGREEGNGGESDKEDNDEGSNVNAKGTRTVFAELKIKLKISINDKKHQFQSPAGRIPSSIGSTLLSSQPNISLSVPSSSTPVPPSGSGPLPSTTPTQKRQRVVTHPPRFPTGTYLRFKTYPLYNHINPNNTSCFKEFKGDFSVYNEYVLYRNKSLVDIHTIPKTGVRLDDLTASRVLGRFTAKQLHEYWPAEFDTKGMIRAVRVPLGDASKMYVHAGEIDADGKTAGSADEGWYYKWWGGIHMLCGEEGFDTYMIRPCFEQLGRGFSFKLSHRAKIQAPEGMEENQIEEVTDKEENAAEEESVHRRETGDKEELSIKEKTAVEEEMAINEEAAINEETANNEEAAVNEEPPSKKRLLSREN